MINLDITTLIDSKNQNTALLIIRDLTKGLHLLLVFFMGISSKLRQQWQAFSDKKIKEIIKMSWQDNTSFEEIKRKFDINSNELEKFLRTHMEEKEFNRWKKRVLSKRGRKHQKKKEKS